MTDHTALIARLRGLSNCLWWDWGYEENHTHKADRDVLDAAALAIEELEQQVTYEQERNANNVAMAEAELADRDADVVRYREKYNTEWLRAERAEARFKEKEAQLRDNKGEVDMSGWPQSRDERLCPHGVDHPEPNKPHHGNGIHGCDGCCVRKGGVK